MRAQQRLGLVQHQVGRRQLEPFRPEAEQQAVLLRHAVEAPTEVRGLGVEVADLLHPLSAPGRRVEERHQPKRPGRQVGQPTPYVVAAGQQRPVPDSGVEPEVDPVEQPRLQPVRGPPVEKEGPLVEQRRPLAGVVGAQVADLTAALSKLSLPARQVGQHQQVRLGHQRGAGADNHDRADVAQDLRPQALQGRRVENVRDSKATEPTEKRIVGQLVLDQLVQRRRRAVGHLDVDQVVRAEQLEHGQ